MSSRFHNNQYADPTISNKILKWPRKGSTINSLKFCGLFTSNSVCVLYPNAIGSQSIVFEFFFQFDCLYEFLRSKNEARQIGLAWWGDVISFNLFTTNNSILFSTTFFNSISSLKIAQLRSCTDLFIFHNSQYVFIRTKQLSNAGDARLLQWCDFSTIARELHETIIIVTLVQ